MRRASSLEKPFAHIYRRHRRCRISEGVEEIQMRRVAAYLFGYLGPTKGKYDAFRLTLDGRVLCACLPDIRIFPSGDPL